MKREVNILIIFALLLNGPALTWAQDEDLSEGDLETLLNENSAKGEELTKAEKQPTPEATKAPVTEEASTPVEAPKAAVESETVAAPETLTEDASSETVDVGDLEALDPTPEAPVKEAAKATEEDLPALEDDEEKPTETASNVEMTSSDDLEALEKDLGDEGEFKPAPIPKTKKKAEPEKVETVEAPKEDPKTDLENIPLVTEKKEATPEVFDVGREERDLLGLAQTIQGQISDNEWNEVSTAAKVDSYTVVPNDWLFKISKKLFGSGFFYPKIWSLNSFITNPHFIEPGMLLSFSTGSGANPPEVKIGSFTKDELNAVPGSVGNTNVYDFSNFGEEVKPKWLDEKGQLSEQGIYFQYASEETMEDLAKAGQEALNREYENYEPPRSEFEVVMPSNYDKSGFDKNSKINYSFKEGFYLTTFVSTNIVQDFGEIVNGPDENIFFTLKDRAYVRFDESINALPGDRFSIYSAMGKASNPNSDREGYKYTIVAQIKLLRKIRDKWEIEFTQVTGTPQRGDRITAYTPKIERITKTYSSRLVEAAILSTFNAGQTLLGYGNVVYLDRGRADGVEMGNVFEVFGFKDRLTRQNITDQPTYKMGELTVITLTDNFATALVSLSRRDFYVGDIAITKTKDAYLREHQAKLAQHSNSKELVGGKALEELDVELNLENLNDDLLKQADKIQLTEDELAELERQEREKSVIKDSERDLKALERLENEVEQAEGILNDAKLDEDKLLEGENLNDLEKKRGNIDEDSLNEIEENLGKRYMDEDLNSKENPYGLTEFDVEEVDDLLNTEKIDTKDKE